MKTNAGSRNFKTRVGVREAFKKRNCRDKRGGVPPKAFKHKNLFIIFIYQNPKLCGTERGVTLRWA